MLVYQDNRINVTIPTTQVVIFLILLKFKILLYDSSTDISNQQICRRRMLWLPKSQSLCVAQLKIRLRCKKTHNSITPHQQDLHLFIIAFRYCMYFDRNTACQLSQSVCLFQHLPLPRARRSTNKPNQLFTQTRRFPQLRYIIQLLLEALQTQYSTQTLGLT